jgi:four helix bundle protein
MYMKPNSYKDLVAWQKAMDLCVAIRQLARSFPKYELYGLASQLRRAAISIPSNIAKGANRNTTGEFVQSLGYARGSLAECETQLLVAHRLGYLQDEKHPVQAAGRLINGLIRSGLLAPAASQ